MFFNQSIRKRRRMVVISNEVKMKTISITDLRKKLFEVINDVFYNGAEYTVLKREKPVAHLTSREVLREVDKKD